MKKIILTALCIIFSFVLIGSLFAQSEQSIRDQLERRIQVLRTRTASDHRKPSVNHILDFEGSTIMQDGQWQNNPSVSINRKNPALIAVGANDDLQDQIGIPIYRSDDGGRSWTTFRVPRIFHWDPIENPTIVSDNAGKFYYMYSAYNFSTSQMALFAASSLDGIHWAYRKPITDTATAVPGGYEYRGAMTVDNNSASPYYGRIYVVWMHLDTTAEHTEARLSWSDDQAKSWSTPIALPRDQGCVALQIHTANHGEVCISYSTFGISAGTHYLLVSKDGCATFEKHSIGSYFHYPRNKDQEEVLKGDNGFPAVPSVALSIEGQVIHAVYGTWMDSSAALFYRSSNDLGAHWSDSIPVGTPTSFSSDRFYPYLSTDESKHETSIIYYSSELDTANRETTVFRSVATENRPGLPAPVTNDVLFDPLQCSANLQTSIGDYIGSDAYNGIFAAAWTMLHGGVIVIYPGMEGMSDVLIYVRSPQSSVGMPVKINADRLWLSELFPNPSPGNSTLINYTIPNATSVVLRLFDECGRCLRTYLNCSKDAGSYTLALDLSGYSSGKYFLRLETEGGVIEKKIELVH
ncbi:MAG: T9SS type A sorting domain-containing protein [Bacteroidota bacterium]|nr:T9SS type A sorting domain-containing protein [Bacteroidota bacterium]